MTWKTMRKRLSALTLAAVLTVTLSVPAAAAEAIGDGVAPTYDEAYYATLDYYGNLLEGSVVKSCAMNGKDCLTDYGVYDEVVNLTDSTEPVSGEGEAPPSASRTARRTTSTSRARRRSPLRTCPGAFPCAIPSTASPPRRRTWRENRA